MQWRQASSEFENNKPAERFVRRSRVIDHDLANFEPENTKATEAAAMPERHCCYGKMQDRMPGVTLSAAGARLNARVPQVLPG